MRLIIFLMLFLSFCISACPMEAYALESYPEPTAPVTAPEPSPSNSAEPSPQPEPARLLIDDRNVYEHMERSYSQGYMPSVSQGTVAIVVPLLYDGRMRGDSIRARLALDASGPFVARNYEKSVPLSTNKVQGGKAQVDGYLVSFSLQLGPNRVNGSYPVTVSVSGQDVGGTEVTEDYTLYVTVTDGKDPDATPIPEPEPTPEPVPTPEPIIIGPKLLVQSSMAVSLEDGAEPGTVNAGDRLRVTVTLLNTSKSQPVDELIVTAASPGESFALLSDTDSVYLGRIEAGGTAAVTYDYRAAPETPAGQYQLALTYGFVYGKAETGSGTGTARLNVSQPLELELSMQQLPKEAVISDTVRVNFQAINLSHAKAYKVRATIEGDGLSPSGTAYIGDLEGGASAEKDMQLLITGLTESDYSYGFTTGSITYAYEDSSGNQYTSTGSFDMEVKSPFSNSSSTNEEPDEPGQYWVIMAAVAAILLGFGGVIVWRGIRGRRE